MMEVQESCEWLVKDGQNEGQEADAQTESEAEHLQPIQSSHLRSQAHEIMAGKQ